MRTKCPKCNITLQFDESKFRNNNLIEYTCPVCGCHLRIVDNSAGNTPAAPVNGYPKGSRQPAYQKIPQQHAQATPVDNHFGPQTTSTTENDECGSHRSPLIWIIPIVVLLLSAIVGGYFYYYKVNLPAKIDREAPRFYTISNATNIRSSKSAGADYNKIGSLPFGSELITYSNDIDWSEIKDASGRKGFIASNYIVNKSDFCRLNSIFGDASSRTIIETVKCRRALLNYFKEHNYIGSISQSELRSIAPSVTPTSDNQWQVFTRAKGIKPNSVWFGRATNPNSKFTDFAVIITNIKTSVHHFLLFSFDDKENATLVYEEDTNVKFIDDVYCYESKVEVSYEYAD